jgi:hypothetical protein
MNYLFFLFFACFSIVTSRTRLLTYVYTFILDLRSGGCAFECSRDDVTQVNCLVKYSGNRNPNITCTPNTTKQAIVNHNGTEERWLSYEKAFGISSSEAISCHIFFEETAIVNDAVTKDAITHLPNGTATKYIRNLKSIQGITR